MESYADSLRPLGIRAGFAPNGNGLTMHYLEAGFETAGRPRLLLLHGFPELAYSWRKVMPALAAAGFHVIAPDQRGYGRTEGWDPAYDGDLASYRALNLVRDVMGLLAALEIPAVEAVVGHDFGSYVAAYCGLLRPDIFKSVALMSAPFAGPPAISADPARRSPFETMNEALGALTPPRKHYHWHYCTREADAEMRSPPQGLHAFLRAYYHYKSGDWAGNRPYRLSGWTAQELAKLPTYYVMDRALGMAATVAPFMPSTAEIEACRWLPDAELAIYAAEYARHGFQGGLHWYRARVVPALQSELEVFSGRKIEAPTCFISGDRDWGIHQAPGALETLETRVSTRYAFTALISGAGHWVQQEAPEAVIVQLSRFLAPR
ncbi:MAG: alpha/beta fold hydrolase [Elsteraceae bacterium]